MEMMNIKEVVETMSEFHDKQKHEEKIGIVLAKKINRISNMATKLIMILNFVENESNHTEVDYSLNVPFDKDRARKNMGLDCPCYKHENIILKALKYYKEHEVPDNFEELAYDKGFVEELKETIEEFNSAL